MNNNKVALSFLKLFDSMFLREATILPALLISLLLHGMLFSCLWYWYSFSGATTGARSNSGYVIMVTIVADVLEPPAGSAMPPEQIAQPEPTPQSMLIEDAAAMLSKFSVDK